MLCFGEALMQSGVLIQIFFRLYLINCLYPGKVLESELIAADGLPQHYLPIFLTHVTSINFPFFIQSPVTPCIFLLCHLWCCLPAIVKNVSTNIVAKLYYS